MTNWNKINYSYNITQFHSVVEFYCFGTPSNGNVSSPLYLCHKVLTFKLAEQFAHRHAYDARRDAFEVWGKIRGGVEFAELDVSGGAAWGCF